MSGQTAFVHGKKVQRLAAFDRRHNPIIGDPLRGVRVIRQRLSIEFDNTATFDLMQHQLASFVFNESNLAA
ncbi:hypothetical protein C6570_00775 [Ottowia oryzae]|uniref:Uncharacterized protein n=1 Tax=Ottowia oryzae TaxID=2109914 RepID=A0A2S0MB54_9BURK|nr:hypothetical protein C6570_00775 [Ottowia oryzae]